MFKLRRPCSNCPFRKGMGEKFMLHPDRLEEIVNGVAFQCHKTVDYSRERPRHGKKPEQCAGLMSLLHREGRPNQIMQLADRLGHWDPNTLDHSDVYETLDAARAAHRGEQHEITDSILRPVTRRRRRARRRPRL